MKEIFQNSRFIRLIFKNIIFFKITFLEFINNIKWGLFKTQINKKSINKGFLFIQ